VTWTKYKEKEIIMRINEITNSTEKLELLRMIDAAIWQSFDAESAYGDYENTETEQGVAATPTANQFSPKPAGIRTTQQPTQKPVKKLTPKQLSDIKTLDHKQLLNYIKTNLKAPTANAPKPATPTPTRPNANPTPITNNSQVPNMSFDTVNAKNDYAKNKDGESDRQA
jgi:hypothetical protein